MLLLSACVSANTAHTHMLYRRRLTSLKRSLTVKRTLIVCFCFMKAYCSLGQLTLDQRKHLLGAQITPIRSPAVFNATLRPIEACLMFSCYSCEVGFVKARAMMLAI